jgi:hypothetical protein
LNGADCQYVRRGAPRFYFWFDCISRLAHQFLRSVPFSANSPIVHYLNFIFLRNTKLLSMS